MKIMFVIATNLSGGAERVQTTLANYFAECGDDVEFVNYDKDSHFYLLHQNVKNIKLSVKYPKIRRTKNAIIRQFLIVTCLIKEMKAFAPDVVIPFLFNAEFPVITACERLHIPCITSVRCSAKSYPIYQRWYRRIKYPKLAGIVFQSEIVKNHHDFKKVNNKTVIYNPLSVEIMKESVVRTPGKIISVGRLTSQKNHKMTINAFSKISDKFPNTKLYIYGMGEEKESLEKLIKKLGLETRIYLKGVMQSAISNNADAELFVMSSDYEGFPNALLEAMACHIPVICTDFDTGIAEELLGENQYGLLTVVGDENSLINNLEYALTNKKEMERMSDMAIKKCEEFDYRNIGRQWRDFIVQSIGIRNSNNESK